VLFFTAPANPLACRSDVMLDDLRSEQLVGKFSEAYWGRFSYDLQERGCVPAQTIDLSSAEAVKRIVASGVGVGVLFESAVSEELERGELVALPLVDFTYDQTYFLVRSESESTPQAERLCAFIRDALALVSAA
jgi:DNA-binding transcriptional LysR family regulator